MKKAFKIPTHPIRPTQPDILRAIATFRIGLRPTFCTDPKKPLPRQTARVCFSRITEKLNLTGQPGRQRRNLAGNGVRAGAAGHVTPGHGIAVIEHVKDVLGDIR